MTQAVEDMVSKTVNLAPGLQNHAPKVASRAGVLHKLKDMGLRVL